MPSTAALLEAWESGLTESPLNRAPALLRSLAPPGECPDPSAMTVGECDRRLLDLRRLLFGPVLETVGRCPECGEQAEFQLRLTGFGPPDAPRSVAVTAHGYRLTCRLPTNADLNRLAVLGADATAADLLSPCVLSSEGPDGPLGPADVIPAEVSEAALGGLADADPGAEILLPLQCPACGAQWQDLLDIRAFLWAEVTAWAHRILDEVHALASSYGWSEQEILALSTWRRRYYLEACGW